MNKNIFIHICFLLILLSGSACIILAFFKPNRLIDSSKRYCNIKDKQGFIRASKKLYVVFGVVCVLTAIFLLLEIITLILGAVIVSFTSVLTNLINSVLIKKYEMKTTSWLSMLMFKLKFVLNNIKIESH